MSWLNIFKFNKTYKDYVLDTAFFKDKSILSYGDAFKRLDILSEIAKITEGEKYHYANLRANEKTLAEVYSLIKHNLTETKNKYSRAYDKKYLLRMAAFDNLMYSPKGDATIPDNVIRVLSKKNKDFTVVND